MKCPNCKHDMTWNSDADAEDLGYMQDGTVNLYSCPSCDTWVQVFTPAKKEE